MLMSMNVAYSHINSPYGQSYYSNALPAEDASSMISNFIKNGVVSAFNAFAKPWLCTAAGREGPALAMLDRRVKKLSGIPDCMIEGLEAKSALTNEAR